MVKYDCDTNIINNRYAGNSTLVKGVFLYSRVEVLVSVATTEDKHFFGVSPRRCAFFI